MKSKDYVLGYDRAVFMRTCTQKRLSENTQMAMVKVIKQAYLKSGSEGADKKAAELTEIINRCQREDEILQAIKEM